MTTSIFPADKTQPFVADNGVTYVWEADRWRVKQYKLDDAALEDYATEEWTEEKIAEAMLDGTVDLTAYATKTYSDGEDDKLQNQIDELATQRGAVREYTVKGVSIGVASRDGELYLSSDEATTLSAISIGIRDNNGNDTPPVEDGDVVDIEVGGAINRYIVASGNISALSLTYQSGASIFAVGNVANLYVYPQNSSSVSKEYVDAQDNALKGYVDYQLGETNDKVGEELEALKEYVDTEIDNLPDNDPVPLDDFMSLTGTQLVTPGNWRIQQNSITKGLSTYISISDEEVRLYHLKEPAESHHAATKGYVDNAISGGGAGGMILDLWTYKGTKNNGNDLNDGEFGSKKLAGGILEIYLANKNSRGVIYHPTPPNSTAEYSHQITESNQGGSPMTVMHQDGRCLWYAETKKIVFNKGTGNYIFIEAIKYRAAFALLVEGDEYMLNVPGFLSSVSGW